MQKVHQSCSRDESSPGLAYLRRYLYTECPLRTVAGQTRRSDVLSSATSLIDDETHQPTRPIRRYSPGAGWRADGVRFLTPPYSHNRQPGHGYDFTRRAILHPTLPLPRAFESLITLLSSCTGDIYVTALVLKFTVNPTEQCLPLSPKHRHTGLFSV